MQACMPSEIIDRGLPTADLLAHIFAGKFADKLPYNRQEGIAAREGVKLSRSILCQWTAQAHELVHPLLVAMEVDARRADYIMTDSTGTLVQAKTRCKKGYFWVYVSGNGHVVYRYSAKNDRSDPAAVFAGYSGIVLADATSTLDALCRDNGIERAGCASHARRYFFKALSHDHNRALVGIGMYNRLFELEADWKKLAPAQRLTMRQQHSRPVFDALMSWCEEQLPLVDDPSPIALPSSTRSTTGPSWVDSSATATSPFTTTVASSSCVGLSWDGPRGSSSARTRRRRGRARFPRSWVPAP